MRSRRGGKTDAQDEPLALRSGAAVFAVYIGGVGRGHQAYGPRTHRIRRLHLRVFPGGAVRARLADVPGPRLDAGKLDARKLDVRKLAAIVSIRKLCWPKLS